MKRLVTICPLKRSPSTQKYLGDTQMNVLNKWREHGVSQPRQTKCGSRGTVSWNDVWLWPSQRQKGNKHYLFPSARSDSKAPHRNKDTVAKAIRRVAIGFKPKPDSGVQVSKIRSHSGRHRAINDLKAANAVLLARSVDVPSVENSPSYRPKMRTSFVDSKEIKKDFFLCL